MSTKRAVADDDDRFPMVIVEQEDKYRRIVSEAQKWHGLPPLNGRALIDAETNEEIWVHRIDDPPHADLPGSSLRPDAASDPDLDIPF
jgi:hypothetical protein